MALRLRQKTPDPGSTSSRPSALRNGKSSSSKQTEHKKEQKKQQLAQKVQADKEKKKKKAGEDKQKQTMKLNEKGDRLKDDKKKGKKEEKQKTKKGEVEEEKVKGDGKKEKKEEDGKKEKKEEGGKKVKKKEEDGKKNEKKEGGKKQEAKKKEDAKECKKKEGEKKEGKRKEDKMKARKTKEGKKRKHEEDGKRKPTTAEEPTKKKTKKESESKVRTGVNRVIADVMAWSMKIAANGVGPERGFSNEEFKESSYRHKLIGKEPIHHYLARSRKPFWCDAEELATPPRIYVDQKSVFREIASVTQLRRGDHCMITLNVLRCLSPNIDYFVSLMGSLELFHLYHHFVILDDVSHVDEFGVPRTKQDWDELRVKSFGAWHSFPKILFDCTLKKARCDRVPLADYGDMPHIFRMEERGDTLYVTRPRACAST
eukprot:g8002.t1